MTKFLMFMNGVLEMETICFLSVLKFSFQLIDIFSCAPIASESQRAS